MRRHAVEEPKLAFWFPEDSAPDCVRTSGCHGVAWQPCRARGFCHLGRPVGCGHTADGCPLAGCPAQVWYFVLISMSRLLVIWPLLSPPCYLFNHVERPIPLQPSALSKPLEPVQAQVGCLLMGCGLCPLPETGLNPSTLQSFCRERGPPK